jgi:hypothetical protein
MQFQASLSKKVHEPPSQQKRLGRVVGGTCHLSYGGKCKEEDGDPDWPRKKAKLYYKNNTQKGLAV